MSTSGGPREPYGDDRWAPYPVQDWSTIPDQRELYDPYAAVDPAWSAPAVAGPPRATDRGRGPRWLPPLVVIMVTVLVAAGLAVADTAATAGAALGGGTDPAAAARFLPGDGAVSYLRRETRVGGSATGSDHVQESARQTGSLVIGGLDFTLGVAVMKVVGSDRLDQMSFWRTTDTTIGNLGDSQQLIRMYRVDGAVELVAESRPRGSDIYSPALVELPAQVRAGDSWASEGSVGSRRYRSQLHAAAADPGCLAVTGTLVESTTSGQPTAIREVAKTWCEGRGVMAERSSAAGSVSTVQSISPPAADPTLRTADEPLAWTAPAGWRRRDFDLMSSDASLGSGIMTGAAAQLAPVVTASGLVFRATNGNDIVATTPKLVDRWVSLWRMHPGGTLLSLAAFGDVVVATTSRRQVVGYSDAGVRLWAVDLDDVAFWAPTRVDGRRVAVADAAGSVRVLDLLSGAVGWTASAGAQVSGPLVATGDTVVALDAGGDTTALAADSGEQRWSVPLPGTRAAIFGGLLVVRNAATLEAVDLRTGRHRWMLPQTGTLDALEPYGDVLVAATQLGTVVVDQAGTVVRKLPAYERVTVADDLMVGWGSTAAEIRDREWRVVATIDTPDVTLVRGLSPTVAYRQGVMVFGAGWTFSTWSDEP